MIGAARGFTLWSLLIPWSLCTLQVGGIFRISVIGVHLLFWLGTAHAEDPPLKSPWIRHKGSSQARGVIVFVHGVLGNSKSTWSSSKSFWPELITHDAAFDGLDVYVYGYPSPLFGRTLSIDNVAENLRLVLADDGVLGYNQVTIVSHSMGGLVTRAFLLKNRSVVPKIRFLYFLATPTTGSPFAKLAALVSKNRQFEQMYPMDTDSYVAPLQANWLSAHLGLKSYCAFETQTLFGQIIVERESATNLCTERLDPIDGNHITMVKPLDTTSTAYRALKVALAETGRDIDLPGEVVDIRGKWDSATAQSLIKVKLKGQAEKATCENDSCVDKILGEYDLMYRDRESMVVATASDDGVGCHACAPELSFFEFARRKTGWALVQSDLAVTRWGQWGTVEPKDVQIFVIGDGIYALFLKDEESGQGHTLGTTAVLARVGDRFQEVLHVDTSEDDSGSSKPGVDQWSSQITIQPGTVGFYDLVIERKGVRDGKRCHERERFKFNGHEYVSDSVFQ